jgi:hypothetical protein
MMKNPAAKSGYRSKRILNEIVGWVETHSADTHRGDDGCRGVYPEPSRRTRSIGYQNMAMRIYLKGVTPECFCRGSTLLTTTLSHVKWVGGSD